MYTKEGTEMHILSMANMDRLGFAKHMLLAATSSVYSTMQYIDVSTGEALGGKPPSVVKNPTTCLRANPANGVVTTCDLRGVVKMWSPTIADPLVQLKAHNGSIHDIAFHQNGRFFVTLGGDHKLKVWDCRKLRTLEEFAVTYAFQTLDISVSGLVALGGDTNIQIWKDMFTANKPSSSFMKFGLGYGNIAEQIDFVLLKIFLALVTLVVSPVSSFPVLERPIRISSTRTRTRQSGTAKSVLFAIYWTNFRLIPLRWICRLPVSMKLDLKRTRKILLPTAEHGRFVKKRSLEQIVLLVEKRRLV